MTSFQFTVLFALAVAFGFRASPSAAFTATSQRCQTLVAGNGKQYRSLNVLNSSPDPTDDMEGNYDSVPENTPPYVPPTPTRNSPEAVRRRAMDPLMASLTRDDSDASPDGPTQTVPIFGEIPADGTMMLLAPAVVFAVLGFITSAVIAFNSADQIVVSVAQTGESIAQTAQNRNNRKFDKDVCRGLCSSQEKDVDGMRNFMEAITRSAREKQAEQASVILDVQPAQEAAPILGETPIIEEQATAPAIVE